MNPRPPRTRTDDAEEVFFVSQIHCAPVHGPAALPPVEDNETPRRAPRACVCPGGARGVARAGACGSRRRLCRFARCLGVRGRGVGVVAGPKAHQLHRHVLTAHCKHVAVQEYRVVLKTNPEFGAARSDSQTQISRVQSAALHKPNGGVAKVKSGGASCEGRGCAVRSGRLWVDPRPPLHRHHRRLRPALHGGRCFRDGGCALLGAPPGGVGGWFGRPDADDLVQGQPLYPRRQLTRPMMHGVPKRKVRFQRQSSCPPTPRLRSELGRPTSGSSQVSKERCRGWSTRPKRAVGTALAGQARG